MLQDLQDINHGSHHGRPGARGEPEGAKKSCKVLRGSKVLRKLRALIRACMMLRMRSKNYTVSVDQNTYGRLHVLAKDKGQTIKEYVRRLVDSVPSPMEKRRPD